MCDRNLGVLARFCPNLAHLHIVAVHKRTLTERGLIHLATRCAKLKHLQLLVKTQFTDASIAAVAGSLVSLTVLGLGKLKLQNPRTLRCLVHCCPQLEILHLQHCNATEAELIYLVTQAKKLKTLEIRQWGQLDFFRGDGYGTDFTLHEYSPQDLPLFGAEEPARVLTRQLEWLGRMAVHTQIEVDSAEKLEAASSHPDFKLVLLDNMSKWAGGVAEEDEEEEGEEEEGDEEVELDEDSEGEEG
ncbi:hypothetical protein B484DRAFT_404833 [Ochromonadaceae sp. CCMP2298]|nr:hypothetical protein B484DRAFT_404833 [Ochromonadaceae sp. CCMP2298]